MLCEKKKLGWSYEHADRDDGGISGRFKVQINPRVKNFPVNSSQVYFRRLLSAARGSGPDRSRYTMRLLDSPHVARGYLLEREGLKEASASTSGMRGLGVYPFLYELTDKSDSLWDLVTKSVVNKGIEIKVDSSDINSGFVSRAVTIYQRVACRYF